MCIIFNVNAAKSCPLFAQGLTKVLASAEIVSSWTLEPNHVGRNSVMELNNDVHQVKDTEQSSLSPAEMA